MMRDHKPIQPMLAPGKAWGLRRLADDRGLFSMVAIDQRPPILQLIARARGIAVGDVAFDDVLRLKRWLVEGLAASASALLVDPNFGYPACVDLLRPDRGLVMTLEEHRYAETPRGRLSASISGWTVGKIRRSGGDAVKVLAWYRPDAAPDVLDRQQRYVRTIGARCRVAGLPFILELLVHPFASEPQSMHDYAEDPGKLPALVIDSVRTFADPGFGVDLFKLESPVPTHCLPADGDPAATDAQKWFDRLGAACGGIPWVMLSAGAPAPIFEQVLRYACRAGASGFLAGRSVWWEAAIRFPDRDAVLDGLRGLAQQRLARLRDILTETGRPCRPTVDVSRVRREGDWARSVR